MELSIETKEIFSFPYFYAFDNGLCEYEYDHVFVSCYEGEVQLNPEEVEAVEWIEFDELLEDIRMNPKKYTPWFIIACPQVIAWLKKNN